MREVKGVVAAIATRRVFRSNQVNSALVGVDRRCKGLP